MNAKTLVPSALAALAAATGTSLTASAADLTVPYGTSTNITANATFDTVTVNGDLTVAQGVTLTVNTYLYVSKDNGGNRATLTVGQNAKVAVNASASSDTEVADIGYDSPATVMLQSGATFSGASVNLARFISSAASDGPPVQFIVTDAAVSLSGVFRCRGTWNNYESVVVCLNGSNTTFEPRNFSVAGNNQRARIKFNGGLAKFTKWLNYGSSGVIAVPNGAQRLVLESVDGNPIRLFYSGGSVGNLFQITYNSTIETTGSGTFQLESPMSSPKPFANLGANSVISFAHTGGFRVLASALLMFDAKTAAAISAMTSGNNVFTVEVGGIVDLNGNGLTLDSIQSAGTITNTSATAATLTVGVNGGDAVFGIAPSVPVVKTGAGALRIPEGDLDSVSVQEGTLDLCDRAAVGYPYYRFWMRAKKSDVNYTGISEFALYNGASEVTSLRTAASQVLNGGYISGNAGHVFDRDFTTAWRDGALGKNDNHALNWRTNRMDFVVHFGNAPSFKFSYPNDTDNGVPHADEKATEYPNLAAPDRPSPLQSVSAYTFAYCDGNSGGLNATPTEWYFQGAMKGNEWRDLDHVVGYNTAGGTAGAWCGTNFVVKCGVSSVAVDSLSVANGATWAIDLSQAVIDVGTLTAGGAATLVVSGVANPKGNVELPVSVGALSGGLSSWRMTFPEHPGVERGVCLEGGTLCATSIPTVIYMR